MPALDSAVSPYRDIHTFETRLEQIRPPTSFVLPELCRRKAYGDWLGPSNERGSNVQTSLIEKI